MGSEWASDLNDGVSVRESTGHDKGGAELTFVFFGLFARLPRKHRLQGGVVSSAPKASREVTARRAREEIC